MKSKKQVFHVLPVPVKEVSHAHGTVPKIVYSIKVENNTTDMNFQTQIAPALRDFMCNNHTDLNDAVDWVCEVFNINATDDLIDAIADEFDSFWGN